jgi:subtilisin family serine protease
MVIRCSHPLSARLGFKARETGSVNIAAQTHFRVPATAAALRALVMAILAVFSLAAHGAQAAQGGKPPATWVKGHILVQPRAGLSDAEFDKALATQGGKAVGRLGNLDIYVVSLPPTASEQAVANALAHHPNIKFAEVDRLVAPAFTPNDADYGSEWHLQTINAPIAWNSSVGTGVTVAILDSGIDATHPDLVGQVVPGWNFYDNNSNTADVNGHGTMVAGVVAARGNNSIGVAGVAWGAKLMPVRVSDASGTGTLSAFANGLTYAADHGARVANLSFPVQSSSSTQAAAQYFVNKGGVVFNSAGNYGALDSTPASSSLVSVSATGNTDTLASWSSYGPYVDLSAPGVGIWTTSLGGGYSAGSGTSFSSPLSAGVAALMISVNPSLAPSQIVSLMESTAVDLGTAGYDYSYGYGRVNAAAAVIAAAQAKATDVQPPSVAITSPTGGTVSGIVPINVTASDNVGVTRVDLLVSGTLLASDISAPYAFSWDSTAIAGSSASLVARAYDAAGNATNSAAVVVSVGGGATPPPSADTTPPTVAITSPGNSSVVTGVVNVNVKAGDNVAVASLSVYVDGKVVVTGNSASISYKWNTKKAVSGAHTISATAKDAAGNQTSTTIQVKK